MRFIEQPESGLTHNECGERRAPTLPSGTRAGSHLLQTPVQTQLFEDRGNPGHIGPCCSNRESNVVLDGEVVVKEVGVREHADFTAEGAPVRRKIVAEHVCCARSEGEESATNPKEGGLSCPVGSFEHDQLAGADMEIDAAEGRKAPNGYNHVLQREFGAGQHAPSRVLVPHATAARPRADRVEKCETNAGQRPWYLISAGC